MRNLSSVAAGVLSQLNPEQLKSPIESLMLVAFKGAGIEVVPQAWIGPYRVDFLIESRGLRIAVECDGREFHHINGQQILADYQRQRALLEARVMVIRFTGGEIFKDPHGCVKEVKEIIEALTGA